VLRENLHQLAKALFSLFPRERRNRL